MRKAIREPMSRPVWLVLVSWGVAVLVISGLLSFWIWTNDRQQDQVNREVQQEQDRAMCEILGLITGGPAPVAGPAGDRAREVLRAITYYRGTLRCDHLPPQ